MPTSPAALARSLVAALAVSLVLAPGCVAASPPSIPWTLTGASILEAGDISAVEIVAESHGLLASDETRHVQPLRVRGTKLVVGQPFELVGGKRELDLEAIAASPDAFFVVGSHGATRSKGRVRAERFQIFRLELDPESGDVRSSRRASLRALLERELPEYVGRPLQRNGTNIEGLAYAAGDLLAGFRGPSVDGRVPVLRFDADGIFDDPLRAQAETHWVELGEGLGIRGMATVPDGFLLLTGDTATDAQPDDRFRNLFAHGHPFQIRFWDGATATARVLHTLELPAGTKAEAIAYLGATGDGLLRVLLVFEGRDTRGPVEIRLQPTAPGHGGAVDERDPGAG